MHTKKLPAAIVLGSSAAACALGVGAALAQHVHGMIDIGIVVAEDEIAVSLEAPLSDVVGFEHAPNNDAQREQLRKAAAVLWNPDSMFALPDSASCAAQDANIEAPEYLHAARVAKSDEPRHADADADHDAGDDHHDHTDDHDEQAHGHDHHSAGHEDHSDSDEGHAEINANYAWKCKNPNNIESLTVLFSDDFANIETVRIQILTSAGARVTEADGELASISLIAP